MYKFVYFYIKGTIPTEFGGISSISVLNIAQSSFSG